MTIHGHPFACRCNTCLLDLSIGEKVERIYVAMAAEHDRRARMMAVTVIITLVVILGILIWRAA